MPRRAGFGFVDAPISGGEQGAKNGQLTIMCGGTMRTYAKAEPVMAGLCAPVPPALGPAGSGQLTKMVNQICIAGIVQGLSEGLSFARAAGLDPQAVDGCDFQGRCAVLADGEPSQDHAGRPSTITVLRWNGCARIWASAWPKRAPMARRCR